MFNWEGANETDVREEFLAPLVRRLGYKRGSGNEILTEVTLHYDRVTLGRKKIGDPKLTGKIDYLLKVESFARWVLEAKAPGEIASRDIDQALSYARHPEVAAIYAAVSNGREFRVYSQNQMSDEPPLIQFDVTTIDDAVERLSNTLHPECVARDFKLPVVSQVIPISVGRRSREEITGGFMRTFDIGWEAFVSLTDDECLNIENSLGSLRGLNANITGGVIERDPQGRIVARFDWASPHVALNDFDDRKGLSGKPLYCLDDEISQDPENPTVFDWVDSLVFNEGEKLFDLATWKESVSQSSGILSYSGRAVGYLKDGVFCGFFDAEYYVAENEGEPPVLRYWSSGTFEVYLRG